ncbi:hypothetical protein K0J45_01150 [Shewanella alkalitolerans]|uniref:hypothetical protein n=1 Tax=Shewanella alkalitolerans TaxID=2864209 RepID=UPI001C65B7A2|nr:hypothetical protein [Shewanella alkalitolerans]QYJ97891.1 hypothetical protein K0J45_01150 [Shewanella alkalitolerans]
MRDKAKASAKMKSATVFTVTAAVVGFTAIGVQSLSEDEANLACVCDSNTSYNSSLPASHPNNRCAQQADNVSWSNWLTGRSRSNQLHFVDLLELLHGHQDSPMDDVTPTSKQRL